MGADIHGWVQVRDTGLDEYDIGWRSVIVVGPVVERDYEIFGALFGVRNLSEFEPVAACRGLPDDVAEWVREEANASAGIAIEPPYHSHTWVTWAELQAVDWEQPVLLAHAYSDGERPWGDVRLPKNDPRRVEGGEWVEGNTTYRVRASSLRELIPTGWQTLFGMMDLLSRQYGSEYVRMVVWFDN